jgi:hypothetical protein
MSERNESNGRLAGSNDRNAKVAKDAKGLADRSASVSERILAVAKPWMDTERRK